MFYWIAMAFCAFMAVVFIAIPHLWAWIPWLTLMLPAMGMVSYLFAVGKSFAGRPRSYLTASVAWMVSKILGIWMLFSDLALLQTNNMSRASIATVGVGGPPESVAETHILQAVFRGWRDIVWWPLKPWGVSHLGRIVHIGHPGSWALLCLKYDMSMAVVAIGLAFVWNALSALESHFWGGLGWLLRGRRPPKRQQSFTPGFTPDERAVDSERGTSP